MFFGKKPGFTLVELLVVMSIIGVLVAALITPVTNALETARTAKCKANLKNLAQAATSYAVATERMPWAGSYEWYAAPNVNGRYVTTYYECPGWVGWTGSGKWSSETAQRGRMATAKFCGTDQNDEKPYLSITNGSLWTYVGKDLSTYICEKHRKAAQRVGLKKVLRSYVMNGYFGYPNAGSGQLPYWSWNAKNGADDSGDHWIAFDSVSSRGSAADLLLFAELPAYRPGHVSGIDSSEYAADGVLETPIRTTDNVAVSPTYHRRMATEVIGFNHLVGKRYVAHVVFADGHVDALIEPKGAKDADLKELTKQLCNGDELDQDLRTKMR